MIWKTLLSCALVLSVHLPFAHAATLVTDASGQLTGATGVNVGGAFYDVSFQDGTCIAVFSGCDELSDFAFQDNASTTLASEALRDQVFNNALYDSQPDLTFGIENAAVGIILTPTDDPMRISAPSSGFRNAAIEANDIVVPGGTYFQAAADTTTFDQYVWAVWTPSDPPATPVTADIEVQPEAPFTALHPQHDGNLGPQGIAAFPDDPIGVVVFTQSTAVGDPVDLDATDIDPTTLAFGPGGGAINPASTPDFSQDVDNDGLNDAQFEFLTSDSGIQCADVDASLSGGLLTSGDNFLGTDAITTDCAAQCHN